MRSFLPISVWLLSAGALLAQMAGKKAVDFPDPETARAGSVYVSPSDSELELRRAASFAQFKTEPPAGYTGAPYKRPEPPNFFDGREVIEGDDSFTAIPAGCVVKRSANGSAFRGDGKTLSKRYVPFKDFTLPDGVKKLTGDWKDGKEGGAILIKKQEIEGDAIAVSKDGEPAPSFEFVN